MAVTYAYSTRRVDLLRPAQGLNIGDLSVGWPFPSDTGQLLRRCAELARLVYAEQALAVPVLKSAGLALAPGGWIGGTSLGARWRNRGTDGWVVTGAGDLTIAAFRGTEPDKPEDWLSDLHAVPVAWAEGGVVHEGFLSAYQAVRDQLHTVLAGVPAGGRLIFTGHSLGAAVATLAAADFRARWPELVTLGSPRVGDAGLAQLLQGLTVHRVVNCCDIVTRIPPARYEAADVADVLHGLLSDGPLSDTLATGMASSLRFALNDPTFVHVGELRYIDRHQVLHTQPPAVADLAADQQLARQEYPDMLATSSIYRADIHANTGDKIPDQVPLRDLADHAPVNYLAGLPAA
jgi:pimeloyl-ACP methyl ester carboxylesterase